MLIRNVICKVYNSIVFIDVLCCDVDNFALYMFLLKYSLPCIAVKIITSCLQQYSVHGAGLYKTHLPYSLVPGLSEDSPAKYIYVYRNPKDVAVSFYHHTQAVAGPIPWDEYVESFMTGGKYIHLGPIFENHLEWWEHKGIY